MLIKVALLFSIGFINNLYAFEFIYCYTEESSRVRLDIQNERYQAWYRSIGAGSGVVDDIVIRTKSDSIYLLFDANRFEQDDLFGTITFPGATPTYGAGKIMGHLLIGNSENAICAIESEIDEDDVDRYFETGKFPDQD